MARKPEGFHLYTDRRTGVHFVRFTHAGRRYNLSTGEADPRAAKVEAAQLYSETVSGRRRAHARGVSTTLGLPELLSEWVAAMDGEASDGQVAEWERVAFTHLEPFFGSASRFTTESFRDYARARLRQVQRSTVKKELSALRRFLRWAHEAGHLPELLEVPSPPRGALGVEHEGGKRRQVRVELTPELAREIIAHLPERAPRSGWPVRAFYAVMWETSLRRSTLQKLEAPKHYRKGAKELLVTRDIDKARFERTLPLSKAARRALDAVCPAKGPIFGAADVRHLLQAAGVAAGLPADQARHLSNHDFRHGRLTEWGGRTTDLTAMAYLAGHTRVSTTAIYVHAHRRAAAALVEGGDSGRHSGRGRRKRAGSRKR
jgi:site-specific recombinase XerC